VKGIRVQKAWIELNEQQKGKGYTKVDVGEKQSLGRDKVQNTSKKSQKVGKTSKRKNKLQKKKKKKKEENERIKKAEKKICKNERRLLPSYKCSKRIT